MSNNERTRESPRKKALQDALLLVEETIKEEAYNDAALAALNSVKDKINNLIGNYIPQVAVGKHYVLRNLSGELLHLQLMRAPTKETHEAQYSESFGPFSTKNGALFVVANGVRDKDEEKRIY